MAVRRIMSVAASSALVIGVLSAPGALAASDRFGASTDVARVVTGADGPVSVMIELDAPPAAAAYAALSGRATRAIATRMAIARVKRLQATVRAQLTKSATRSEVLFEASNAYAGIAVLTDSSRIDALRALPGVKAVHRMVPKTRGNFIAVPLVRAPSVWVDTGFLGEDVTVGIIDTGIDYTHADFGGPGTVEAYDAALTAKTAGEAAVYPDPAKVAGGYDFAGNAYDAATADKSIPQPDNNPLDCEGHGTHVAGTAAGYGVAADGTPYAGPWDDSTPFDTMMIGPGVAPRATLYALKVFGCEGSTNLVVESLDWAMDPNGDGDLSDHLDVVNMSLGSSFGSDQDPDSVATNNAVDAGVMVVASAGNSGDIYEITGSPGVATKALSVAASEDRGQVVDAYSASIDGAAAQEYSAMLSADFAWTSGVTDTAVVLLGDWSAPPSSENNTDACSPLSEADAAKVAGKIVLLQWIDDAVERRCGSAGRSDRVHEAGAVGAILGSQETFFTISIAGSASMPVVLSGADGTNALASALAAGTAVTATLSPEFRSATKIVIPVGPEDPTDMLTDFTSRGTALAGNVKPNVSAPGSSIFSARSGAGDGGESLSGTSMAAPATAGLAALMVEAHPTWSASEIKAGIMNTADHDLFLDAGQSGPRYDVLRAGSGRIDAAEAVSGQAVAYVVDDPGAVSASFGVMNVRRDLTRTKTIRIADKRTSGSAVTYRLSLEPINALDGVTYSVAPSSVRLQPGKRADVVLTLTVAAGELLHKADPTITLDQAEIGIMRDFLTDASSLLLATPSDGSPILRVPVFSAPRPASAISAGSGVTVSGSGALRTGQLTLRGQGIDRKGSEPYEAQVSRVSALQLVAESPRLPNCTPGISSGCVATRDQASADLRYVGFTSDARLVDDPLSADAGAMAYFGVSTWQPWRTAADISYFAVFLDTGNDGTPDAVLLNSRLTDTDIFVTQVLSLRMDSPFALIDEQLINNVAGNKDTAKMHSNVMTLPVSLGALANPTDADGNPIAPFISEGSTTVSYWIETTDAGLTVIDAIGHPRVPLRVDLAAPPLTAFDSAANMPAKAMPGRTLTVTLDPATAGANPRLLMLHHLNALSRKAQVVPVATGG